MMCGRSSLHDAPVNVLERFRLPPVLPGFVPRYNIAPSEEQWTLGLDEGGAPTVAARKWGLVPSWADDPAVGNRLINARAESVFERPAFSDAMRARRCLVLADGFYEWSGTGKSRVPHFFHLDGDRAFPMAGLWERWARNGEVLETCTVITTRSSALAARVHDRMPVLLTLDGAEQWLDKETSRARLRALMAPYEAADLRYHEVSRLVNTPANDSPDCIVPAPAGSVENAREAGVDRPLDLFLD